MVDFRISDWMDEVGMVHNVKYPTPDSSENETLFTGTHIVLASKLNYRAFGLERTILSKYLYDVVHNKHISHDNATGIMCACEILEMEAPVPVFNRQRLHPRDIVMYGYARYPWFWWWFLWIPMLAMVVSCLQDYKVRNGRKILKTDGKILALIRCLAFDMKITLWLCENALVFKDWPSNGKWRSIFYIYYKDSDHPNVQLAEEYDRT